ncbi:hypothetical protein BDP55DRAFT_690580 [Colletotrichum godetiae]|uniref:ATP phosphoribosyltransferase n=1 Tax=Colletotrichum godetiae TaxID=1209918 RepID=A0AAJ0AUW5_9PEZI|nr:uncharacterized protein BDP55DRAFT_690580 [Colletotrichum godetiae]KAK1690765.1 hypothetical protein BDP55DRAFT_690580 [Colletotrichum godetiae]
MADRYRLIHTVPASHLVVTKDTVFETGVGVYDQGKYIQVAFELTGQGQFRPVAAAGADPHTGSAGQLEDVEKAAVAALKGVQFELKSAHPYKTPAYEVYRLVSV